jgi:hypothetical protein
LEIELGNLKRLQSVFSGIPNEGYRMHIGMDGMKTAVNIIVLMFAEKEYVWLLFIRFYEFSAQT